MRLDEPREEVHAAAAQMRARGVDGEHHVEPLGLFVDRREALVAQDVAAVGRQHRADVAELADRAPELLRRSLGVLDRQEGDGSETRARRDELLVHEGVVRAAELHRPGAILDEAHEEPERREEHRLLHAALVERPEPGVGGRGGVVELRDEPPVPAVGRNDREDELPVAERRVHVLHHLLGGLGHVAIGVDDCHGPVLLTASCRSR